MVVKYEEVNVCKTAFKVLELGLQWGCDQSEDVTNDTITEGNVLEAFRAEIDI